MRRLQIALTQAWLGVAARPRRTLLGALGIVLAAAMLSAAVVVMDGLGEGFPRAARAADLGDVILRFSSEPEHLVARRIATLPDLAGYALRSEVKSVPLAFHGHSADNAVVEVIGPRRRQGYALVAGREPRGGAQDVLVEPAFASAWHISLGARIEVGGLGPERVVGLVEGPDDVGFPLAAARVYITRAAITARLHSQAVQRLHNVLNAFALNQSPRAGRQRQVRAGPDAPRGNADPAPIAPGYYTAAAHRVNFAEIWLRDPRQLDEVLVQARSQSYGLRDLQFATRAGVHVLVHQAAGLVIDLLVALSAIALLTAAVMLAASARAEVQRRLHTIGVQRALGATRGAVVRSQAIETLLVALPAASLGTLVGWLLTSGPSNRLLALLNEPGAGSALILPLLGVWLAGVLIPLLAAVWPTWTATGRPIVALLGDDSVRTRASGGGWLRRQRSHRSSTRGSIAHGVSPLRLGARLAAKRPARLVTAATMLACSTAFVLLMLALAATLSSLETDPQELGRHYQMTVGLPPAQAPAVTRVAGVQAAEPRYEVHAVDAYSLGEVVDVIAYPRKQALFESPPLASGRRASGPDQAEVGTGLADLMGLSPGARLLLELPGGGELNLRVSGTVSSLDEEGRVAYVPASALLAVDPAAASRIAVLLQPHAHRARVERAITRLGAAPRSTTGAVARGGELVSVLKTILFVVAIVDGLVCIYALVQTSTLTVAERRRTLAVLQACGAGTGTIRRLLAGSLLALIAPAAVVGIALERLLLGPALSRLAVSYTTLALDPTLPEILAILIGLGCAGAAAVLWTARAAGREPVLAGLRG